MSFGQFETTKRLRDTATLKLNNSTYCTTTVSLLTTDNKEHHLGGVALERNKRYFVTALVGLSEQPARRTWVANQQPILLTNSQYTVQSKAFLETNQILFKKIIEIPSGW